MASGCGISQRIRELNIEDAIDVNAKATRNLEIFLHWGYNEYIQSDTKDGGLALYYVRFII